jgi:hypothetical protein
LAILSFSVEVDRFTRCSTLLLMTLVQLGSPTVTILISILSFDFSFLASGVSIITVFLCTGKYLQYSPRNYSFNCSWVIIE